MSLRAVALGEVVRVVDHDVKPGVEADMGDGDEWPVLRRAIGEADILIIATPTWMGHASSIAHRLCPDGLLAVCDNLS